MNTNEVVQKTMVICGIVVVFAGLTAFGILARNLLPLLFGAVLIAVVLSRLAGLASDFLPQSVSRQARIGCMLGTLAILSIASVVLFANSASKQVARLTDRVESSVKDTLEEAKAHPFFKRFVAEDPKVSSLIPSSAKSLGMAKNFFATTFGGIVDCLILIVLSAYFAFSPQKYLDGITRLVPVSWRDDLASLFDQSSETLWRWMIGRSLAMLLVGVLFGIGLAIIGVPMPIELGVFAAIVTFIPNIGGLAAVIPALLLSFQQGSSSAISVLALYLGIQFVESYVITPMVQEHQVALPPAMVIVAQIVAGLLFGFWGIVFATPLVAVAILWVKSLYVERYLEASTS